MPVPESIDGKVTKAQFLEHAVEINLKPDDADIAAEADARTAADSALGALIDGHETRIDTLESAGATTLAGLTDVDLTGQVDGDFLTRSAGTWVAGDPPAATAAATSYAGSAGLSATDVEAALDELDTEKASVAALTAHEAAADPHSGYIGATETAYDSDRLGGVNALLYQTAAQASAAYAPIAAKGAKGTRGTNQSIPHATDTVVSWTTEEFDTDAYHNTGTNPSRFTVPAGLAGMHRLVALVNFASNATGSRQVYWTKNGTLITGSYMAGPTVSGSTTTVQSIVDVVLAVDDYVEVAVYQSSGGALDVSPSSAASITRLGA